MISALLPAHLLTVLAPLSEGRAALLQTLSSGQLLCEAYNVGVRKSRKPWGYVSKDSVHDLVALESSGDAEREEKAKRGWTFRRVDNLRIWAACVVPARALSQY